MARTTEKHTRSLRTERRRWARLASLAVLFAGTFGVVLAGACSDGKHSPAKTDKAEAGSEATAACKASEAARKAYSDCRKSSDEGSCTKLGGTWKKLPGGYSQGPVMGCACTLPDDGCPCTRSGDCAVRCEMSPPADWKSCPAQGPARCTGGGSGCYCFLDDKGKAQGMCQD